MAYEKLDTWRFNYMKQLPIVPRYNCKNFHTGVSTANTSSKQFWLTRFENPETVIRAFDCNDQ